MKLTLEEAQKISTELKSKFIQATVGVGLDKLYFYVYSTDPMITCNCSRWSFDKTAKEVTEKRLSQFDNVVVTATGVPRAASV